MRKLPIKPLQARGATEKTIFGTQAALRKVLKRTKRGIQYVEHTEGDVQSHLQTWPGGHRLKTQRALQVRAVKGVAKNQKSEGARRYSRY
jgi:hypothetical protein